MSHDERLLEILVRYEELLKVGKAPSPEEFCRDCPELLEKFRQSLKDIEEKRPFFSTAQEGKRLGLSVENWKQFETVLDGFANTWGQEPRPRIEDVLDSNPSLDRLLLLRKLVPLELELRIKAGEKARVEEYLIRYPHLEESFLFVLEMAKIEFEVRRQVEPDLKEGEYFERFPDHSPHWPTLAWQGDSGKESDRSKWPSIPGYQILEKIGEGGMGVVYKAQHLKLNRVVALKMIKAGAGASTEDLVRFRNEAEAVARLSHEHIVQIYDIGEHEISAAQRLPYFSLEFVAGGTLGKKLNGTPQKGQETAALVEKLARAMHAAHQRDIIHRDLKPGNVLLTTDGQPKITDFGLAWIPIAPFGPNKVGPAGVVC